MICSCTSAWSRLAAFTLLVLLASPTTIVAVEFRPALLEIHERKGGWVDVIWKVPMIGDRVLALKPVLPEFLEPLGPGSKRRAPGGWVESSSYRSVGQSLNGSTLRIEGLSAVPTDVLVRITLLDETEHSAILRSGNDSFTIPEQATRVEVAGSYWRMGTIHILEGSDHLLFVLALLLIVTGFGQLLKAVTAFTVAHSITLTLATLGFVHVPSAPTEAIISLSILFLAAEIVHKYHGETGLTERYPWLIAFIFGLFHGLGFAGALSEIGVPQHEVPLALFMFNIGVETGQILFIAVVVSVISLLRRLPVRVPEGAWRLMPYCIGSLAGFWTIERTLSFLF